MKHKQLDTVNFDYGGKTHVGMVVKDKTFNSGFKIISGNISIDIEVAGNIKKYPEPYKNEDRKIDWKKINVGVLMRDFPNTREKYVQWRNKQIEEEYSGPSLSSYVRFFEINDIIIEIGIDRTMEPKFAYEVWKYNPDDYSYELINEDGIWLRYTRTDATIDGVLEAFKFMEKNIVK